MEKTEPEYISYYSSVTAGRTTHSLYSKVYSSKRTVYGGKLLSFQFTETSLQSIGCNIQCEVYSLQYMVYNIDGTVYSLQSSLFKVQ